jgi:general secretion pathway protein E/type IV pilus assembly protein PilB
MGLFELLVTTDSVRQLAHDRVSTWELKRAAMADGMRTLRHDGWRKVLAGRTTVDEVVRVAKADKVG